MNVDRITVGFCSNLRLLGFFSLKKSSRTSPVEVACQLSFRLRIENDKYLKQFAKNLTGSGDDNLPKFSVVATTAQVDTRFAWRLVSGRSTNPHVVRSAVATLEILGSTLAFPQRTPVTLLHPTEYLDAEARVASEDIDGVEGVRLRWANVCAVFELFVGPGRALYLCVRREGGPLPRRGERLRDYCARALDAAQAPEAALVYCAVECGADRCWMFTGFTTEIELLLYRALAESQTLKTITNASTADARTWRQLTTILPLVHVDAHRHLAVRLLSHAGTEPAFAIGTAVGV